MKKLKVTFGNIDRCHAVALAACNDNGRRYRCPGSNVPVSGSMAGPNQKHLLELYLPDADHGNWSSP